MNIAGKEEFRLVVRHVESGSRCE